MRCRLKSMARIRECVSCGFYSRIQLYRWTGPYLRQESEQRFGGRFRLDCRFHDRWSRDEIPYGIRVADARFGGQGGSPMGLVTLRAKAFCDGLMACDYLIKPPDGSAQTGDFSARWYCGSKEKTLRQQDAKSETRVQLVCP